MKKTDNDFELIERFLEGSLNQQESADFLHRVESDPEFAKMFSERKLLQKTYTEASKRMELKKQLKSLITDEKRKTSSQRKIWLAAASLIVLAVIGSLLYYNSGNPGNEKQYAKELPSPDEAVQGNQNNMEEYGNMDVVERKESVDDFFPDEFTPLKTNDTICFKWPSSMNLRYLTIYNSKGELVKKVTIKKKVKEYVLLPGILKPGVYYWKFMNDSTLIRITVSNQ
ncbi:MAG: hypothetical protein JNL22_14175 [Bacteroidales bacterium]|nr:hypothetical protein [Bacteroidales bacterium]